MPQTTRKVAIVTGANRGIGFETCRQLSQRGVLTVLTSRDESKGREAVEKLQQEGGEIIYHQLDVIDADSISRLRVFIEQNFHQLDILVNNAGVFLDRGESVFVVDIDVIQDTLETNFYGALNLCRAFVPLMKQQNYGRIVNVSSGLGALTSMGGRAAGYKISKAALNALTRIMADEVRGDNIKLNAVSPGWVRSDMGGSGAVRSVAQGADTVVWLATLPDDGPTGGFFQDRQPIPW
jgi:NAD(P)-dependent dehydrogenase (short-subunit alcohol dehydrogenase family)